MEYSIGESFILTIINKLEIRELLKSESSIIINANKKKLETSLS